MKVPWSEDEQKLFTESLEKHGPKSMKEIADDIGSRSVVQVRSHLQKHLLKEGKSKQYSQIIAPPSIAIRKSLSSQKGIMINKVKKFKRRVEGVKKEGLIIQKKEVIVVPT